MAGIDVKVMTDEAIRMRKGETVLVDGVHVRFSEKGKLQVVLGDDDDGMTGHKLHTWMNKNAKVIGYVPLDPETIAERPSPKKVKGGKDNFEPLQPYIEG